MTPFAQYATSLQRASYTTTLEHIVRKMAEHYGHPPPTGCWFEKSAEHTGEYAALLVLAAQHFTRLTMRSLPCPSSPNSPTILATTTASSKATADR